MSDCSLRSRGSRLEAAAFLSHSQTTSMSARSFVQDSGARSWAQWIREYRRSQLFSKLLAQCLNARSARADRALNPRDSRRSVSDALVDQIERPDRVPLLGEFGHTGVDLAAREVVDLQTRHDLICAIRNRARE